MSFRHGTGPVAEGQQTEPELEKKADPTVSVSSTSVPRPKLTAEIATACEGVEVELLAKINEAVAAANEAEMTVTTAQAELVSRSKKVGLLVCDAFGDADDGADWIGHTVRLVAGTGPGQNNTIVDMVRIEIPDVATELPAKPKPPKPSPAKSGGGNNMDDEIPFAPVRD